VLTLAASKGDAPMPNKRVKTFLHVGCGPLRFDPVSRQADSVKGFPIKDWQELRLDIDPAVTN
jgi:hypothetical protein